MGDQCQALMSNPALLVICVTSQLHFCEISFAFSFRVQENNELKHTRSTLKDSSRLWIRQKPEFFDFTQPTAGKKLKINASPKEKASAEAALDSCFL